MSKLLSYFKTLYSHKLPLTKPFLIAESGVNHEGDIELAKRLVEEAQEGGADAIKFQTYKAETLACQNSPAYWDISKESTTSQFRLFKKYDKFWKKEYEKLKIHCDTQGIEFMSTPFDIEAAKFLSDLMPVFKISSSDIDNHPFIEYICRFNKPIILSTGASYTWEIQETVDLISKNKNPLCLMHCVLNYPTDDVHANLGVISYLKCKFPECMVGYSDHTLPKEMETLKIATLLGARIIEKHFTHNKQLPGNDHYHAMDKEDIKMFKKKINDVLSIVGSSENTVFEHELISRKNARRSLVALENIKKGDILTTKSLTWKRPSYGISPKFISKIIGKIVIEDIKKDEIIYWNQIKFR